MKKMILSIGLLMFVLMMARAQEQKPETTTPPNPNAPEIKFESDTHDYGTIQKDASGACTFTFTNTGKEPLIISNCKTSCGCTVPNWSKDPVLPGQKGTIEVNYTKTNQPGEFNKSITVLSNAKNSTVILIIKGKVVAPPAEMTPEKQTNNAPINK
jgi:hypothetical protein